MRLNSILFIFVFTAASSTALAQSGSASNPDEWKFQLTPYLWLPTIDGNLNYGPPQGGSGGSNVSVGPTDWLELLNAAFLLNASARKGRFSVSTDLVYLGMEKTGDSRVLSVSGELPAGPITIPVAAELNLDTQSELDGLSWTLVGGYTIKESTNSSVDLIAGLRYFEMDASTNWNLSAAITTPGGTELLEQQGSIAADTDLWDFVIGVKGYFALGTSEKWSAPYYLDAGTGDSDLTWNAMIGLNRTFGWGDLMLVYRHLEYDEGSDGLVENFSFSGPAFGARFYF